MLPEEEFAVKMEMQIRNRALEFVQGLRVHSAIDQSLGYLMESVKSGGYSESQLRAMVSGLEEGLKEKEVW